MCVYVHAITMGGSGGGAAHPSSFTVGPNLEEILHLSVGRHVSVTRVTQMVPTCPNTPHRLQKGTDEVFRLLVVQFHPHHLAPGYSPGLVCPLPQLGHATWSSTWRQRRDATILVPTFEHDVCVVYDGAVGVPAHV